MPLVRARSKICGAYPASPQGTELQLHHTPDPDPTPKPWSHPHRSRALRSVFPRPRGAPGPLPSVGSHPRSGSVPCAVCGADRRRRRVRGAAPRMPRRRPPGRPAPAAPWPAAPPAPGPPRARAPGLTRVLWGVREVSGIGAWKPRSHSGTALTAQPRFPTPTPTSGLTQLHQHRGTGNAHASAGGRRDLGPVGDTRQQSPEHHGARPTCRRPIEVEAALIAQAPDLGRPRPTLRVRNGILASHENLTH